MNDSRRVCGELRYTALLVGCLSHIGTLQRLINIVLSIMNTPTCYEYTHVQPPPDTSIYVCVIYVNKGKTCHTACTFNTVKYVRDFNTCNDFISVP